MRPGRRHGRARPTRPRATRRSICLSWAANYLVFGGRIDGGRRADARGSPRLGGRLPRRSSRRRWALVHQVRAARASAAGDLGRCLGGLESALQAFEQAGDLRNACAVRTNLGYVYCELGDFQRAEAALRQALGGVRSHGPARSDRGRAAQPGARAGPARRARPRPSGWSGRRSTTSAGRAIRAWRARRARTWRRS